MNFPDIASNKKLPPTAISTPCTKHARVTISVVHMSSCGSTRMSIAYHQHVHNYVFRRIALKRSKNVVNTAHNSLSEGSETSRYAQQTTFDEIQP